ncbi:Translation protein SH3-like domain [Phytophthora cactorum]|nr:Translation protein SH3-like domain [Phytophthora cactorum]
MLAARYQELRAHCRRRWVAPRAASQCTEQPKRTKLKIPTKRAASLLQQLEAEAVAKASEGKDIDSFKPGDSVEVQYLLNRTGGRVQRVKGVVLARRNRGTGSSFVIRNHIGGYGYEQKIFLHSPLLQSVKVLQEAFIHKGKKRVRAQLHHGLAMRLLPTHWDQQHILHCNQQYGSRRSSDAG